MRRNSSLDLSHGEFENMSAWCPCMSKQGFQPTFRLSCTCCTFFHLYFIYPIIPFEFSSSKKVACLVPYHCSIPLKLRPPVPPPSHCSVPRDASKCPRKAAKASPVSPSSWQFSTTKARQTRKGLNTRAVVWLLDYLHTCSQFWIKFDELGPSWTTCGKIWDLYNREFSAAVACGKVEWGSNLMASHVIYKHDILFDVVTGSLRCCNIFWQGSMRALRAKTEAPAVQTRRRKNKQSSYSHKIFCFKISMYHPLAKGFAFELQISSCMTQKSWFR